MNWITWLINQLFLFEFFFFTDEWKDKWTYSEHPGKEFGKFVRTAGKFYNDQEKDQGKFDIYFFRFCIHIIITHGDDNDIMMDTPHTCHLHSCYNTLVATTTTTIPMKNEIWTKSDAIVGLWTIEKYIYRYNSPLTDIEKR